MKRVGYIILSAILISFAQLGHTADSYKIIDPAHATDVAKGKVEVVEIFWYGCPHCYEFEPHVKNWLENKPAEVEFKRLPGIFSEKWIPHARAYYAAMEMGVLDKIHTPLFEALHEQKRNIFDMNALIEFVSELGIDKAEFKKAYESEAVDDKVKKAFVAGRRYQVRGVPSLVVNGKYLISSSSAGSFDNMLKVTGQLVDKEKE